MKDLRMSDIDLTKMNLEELKQLQKDVAKAISSFQERQRQEALAAAKALAESKGFKLEELLGKKGTSSIPKYQNPENPKETWTGKGRKPKWFIEQVESGKDPKEMLFA